MDRIKKVKALYSLIGLSNKAKDLGDYKLGNLTFGLGMAFLEDDEAKITYEDAGSPLSAYYDIVSISLNDRCLCIPAPLLNKDTLVECLKKGKIIERLDHYRQYRLFENLDEWKRSFYVIVSRYFKILREYFDINVIESALWALDLSEERKEFEEWCFRFLCQSEANTAQDEQGDNKNYKQA